MNIIFPGKATEPKEKSADKVQYSFPGAATPPNIARILVAIDFSDGSKTALKYAVSLAEKFGSSLALVHASEPCVYPEDLSTGASIDSIDERWTEKKRKDMEALRLLALKKETPSTVFVLKGTPWEEIVGCAKSWGADLIVIGTRGLTGLKHVLMGSTAEKVVRHAACPVFVVHAGQ